MSLSDTSSSSLSSDEEIPSSQPAFKKRMKPFEFYDDSDFKNKYRLSKAVVMKVVNMIRHKIEPLTMRNKPISAIEQVLLTINFYTSGGFQMTVADNTQVHKSTACRIIQKVSKAIAELRPELIAMPTTQENLNRVKNEFYNISSFPNVIGAVGCTHIKIHSPGPPGSSLAKLYKNREGYFSLKVQIISDAKLNILDVIARWPGSAHDTTIINDSHIRADFENGVYGKDFLLGDSDYPCRSYLLTPFLHPSTPSEERYNQAHLSTRNTVERCIDVLKRRFPCLSMGLRVKLETSMSIIVACCVLHNLALRNNDFIEDSFVMELNLESYIIDTGTNLVSDENTSVRSSLLSLF